MILESLVLALISGLFGGLVGLGGGIVLVPALSLVLGVPITMAIPVAQVAVVATAMGGTARYIRDGHADMMLAIRAGSVTVLGALAGAKVGVLIPARALELGFAALILIIVVQMLLRKSQATPPGPPAVKRAGLLFLVAGLLAGMLGVGGGILNVPAIRLALKRTMITAVGTSAMIVAFTGAAGATVYARAGRLDWLLAASCTTGAFAGGILGASLSSRIKTSTLQYIFLVVILYVGIEMAVRALSLPWWR